MYSELPQDAQTIWEVQLCRYFRRAMPPNWQDKLAFCEISTGTITELAMYFERLERRERQNGRDRQNGQGTHGEWSQGRRDQQRSFNARYDRGDRRNQREYRDSHENRPHKRTVTDDKKKNERHDDNDMWCKFHKTKSHNSSECFALKKQREEHKPAEIKTTVPSKKSIPNLKKSQATRAFLQSQ
uniref:Retrotransposon gag domain-containing protein n=1 Tax=Peronospora matthiolae TaxID=2874970 RepID=A0AAV1TR35_9STRA